MIIKNFTDIASQSQMKAVVIDGVRFIGTTLWTDFNLNNDPYFAIEAAKRKMSDYSEILSSTPAIYSSVKRITPDEIIDIHNESLSWLKKEVPKPSNLFAHMNVSINLVRLMLLTLMILFLKQVPHCGYMVIPITVQII